MNTHILNVLCEGKTEDRFVHEVLRPYLKDKGLVVKHRLLITNKKKNAVGGLLSYEQARKDLTTWIKEVSSKRTETHYFTTMFDMYALPDDFPGWKEPRECQDDYEQVESIESAFKDAIQHPRFIPYIQLHEFEALVFCGLDKLLLDYPGCEKEIEGLKQILDSYGKNPEKIDRGRPPSKCIIKAIEKKFHYDKPKSGTSVTRAVGIDILRGQCPHFDRWIEQLEQQNRNTL